MSRIGVGLLMRMMVMAVTFLGLTVITLFSWQLIGPWAQAFADPGGGMPSPYDLLPFVGVGSLLLPVVLFVWYWFAPVRQDRRQDVAQRRP